MLYSNGGFALSTSNNALTFDYFPAQSIDRAEEPERVAFTPTQRAELEAITDPRGIAQSAWYWRQGMDFIRSHPGLTLWRAVRKMDVAWSPVFSPAKGAAFESVYLAFYLPLLVLAPIGIWRSRHRWRETGYIVAIFVMFTLGAGVFWAHTSHRMYVEPYLMIFAAAVVTGRASAALPDHR